MDISVTIRDEDLKKKFESIQKKFNNKIDKLNQYTDELHAAKLVVNKSGFNTLSELSIRSHNKDFFAKSKRKIFQESINNVIDKIERQLKKEFDKYTTKRNKKTDS